MSWLASVALALLHVLYRLVLVIKSLSARFSKIPRPLLADCDRSKLPSHLALCLIPDSTADDESNEKYMLNSVVKVATWCQVVGIRRLTVYDREGVLANCSLDLRERLFPRNDEDNTDDSPVERQIQYPPTPPPSDDADSRPDSPQSIPLIPKLGVTTIRFPTRGPKSKRRASIKRRRVARSDDRAEDSPLTVHVVSYKSGKPAVAAAATTLLRQFRDETPSQSAIASLSSPSIQELNAILEGEYGFSSPDLMIVHRKPPARQLRPPVELDGFPPWQMRLTEIYWDPYPRMRWSRTPQAEVASIDENEFRSALDEFASAEMRLGK
ncbi:hypothetical protein C8Q76DRAFT_791672 [Earliella scabrosa]|nr:hypothetical protein C8Q76DRAFT_791672 [Earliella scabrosa]